MKKSIIARAYGRVRGMFSKAAESEGGFELLARLSGETMTPTSALRRYGRSLYVFACVSKIAQKVASIPLEMYRIVNANGDVKEAPSHPALNLLYRPNPFQTKNEFMQLTVINLKCTGEAFWFKVRNERGDVAELWNLRPDWVTVVTDPKEGVRGYRFAREDGAQVWIDRQDAVHIKYPNPLDQWRGMGPLKASERRVETEEFATRYQRDFFLNSARPDAILSSDDANLTADQKEDIREGWNQRHRGAGRTSKVAVLEGGLKYQVISLSQKEMDYIESLKGTRDDILVAFGMPKSVLGITEDVNRANAEAGMFVFLSEVVKPCNELIVEKANEELVIPDFGEEWILASEDPTPADRELALKEYEQGIRSNYLLINEVRAREGLSPMRGGWSFYLPVTTAPVGGLSSEDQKAAGAVLRGIDEAENERRFLEWQAGRRKRVPMHGRLKLQVKFALRSAMEKAAGSEEPKAKASAKASRPIIRDEGMRKAYADMVNRKIDAKAGTLRQAADAFFSGQEARVVSELKRLKDVTVRGAGGRFEKAQIDVTEVFDSSKEAKVAVELISPYVMAFLQESGQDALDMAAPQEDFMTTPSIEAWVRARARKFAEEVNSTTLEGLEATLAEGIAQAEGIDALSRRVAEKFGEWRGYRSDLIARTEATAANNEGLLRGFEQSGVVTGKEWLNARDSRVRTEHQDAPVGVGGEIVGLKEAFSNGLSYPDEPNCRCVLAPAIVE